MAVAFPRSEAVASSRASASIPGHLFLTPGWAPPSGSPADLPLVFTYKSDATSSTEFGSSWSAPYHRFAEPDTGISPAPGQRQHPKLSLLLHQQRHILFRRGPRAKYADRQRHHRLDRDPARRHQLQVRQHGRAPHHQEPGRRPLDADLGRRLRPRAGDPGTLGPPHLLRLQRVKLRPAHRGPRRPDHDADGQCQQRPRADRQPPALRHVIHL